MSVDDHGWEALKKAAEEITPGDKSEYVHRVRRPFIKNTFRAVRTNVTDVATQIILPDGADEILLRHFDNKDVWFGEDATITTSGNNTFRVLATDAPLRFTGLNGVGSLNLYGITTSGVAVVQVLGILYE